MTATSSRPGCSSARSAPSTTAMSALPSSTVVVSVARFAADPVVAMACAALYDPSEDDWAAALMTCANR